MTRPKKKQGFRQIVVDGRHYRWRLSWDNRTADIEIHQEETPSVRGRRLCVYLDTFELPSQHTQSEIAWPPGRAVTPAFIEAVMRDAMSKGWKVSDGTADFNLLLRCEKEEKPSA